MSRRSGSFRRDAGLTLHTLTWRPSVPERGLVVLAHGYAEHSGRYDTLAKALVERGYLVHALDFPGHGRSAGPRGEVRSFDGLVSDLGSFIATVRADHPGLRCGLFAHSMGGAVATALCSQQPDLVDALVLSAPYLRHGERVSKVRERILRTAAKLLPRLPIDRVDARNLSRLPAQVEAYLTDPLVHHAKANAGTVVQLFEGFAASDDASRITAPLLVLHGNEDKIADPRASQELIERVAAVDITFERVAGGYHELLNDLGRERIVERVVDWFDVRLDEHRPSRVRPDGGP